MSKKTALASEIYIKKGKSRCVKAKFYKNMSVSSAQKGETTLYSKHRKTVIAYIELTLDLLYRHPSNPCLQILHSLYKDVKLRRLAINEESSQIGIVSHPRFTLRFGY